MNENIFGFVPANGNSYDNVTITGKYMDSDSDKSVIRLHDLEDGESFTGKPEVYIIVEADEYYNKASIKLMGVNEDLIAYVNFDKRNYPLIRDIDEDFVYYRDAFNIIKSVLLVNGAPISEDTSKIREVNFKEILEYIDGLDSLTIEAIEYDDNPEYKSLKIVDAI